MKINNEYKRITNPILMNENFQLLKKDTHHGTNKFEHSKRVSYLSFLIAKIFKADSRKSARAGLLHDFFFGSRTEKEENSYLNHPLTSSKNAKKYFDINIEEANIIESHMYHHALVKHLNPFVGVKEKEYLKNNKPKNKEGVIVCVADLLVSVFECCVYKIRYSVCLYIIFMLNVTRY